MLVVRLFCCMLTLGFVAFTSTIGAVEPMQPTAADVKVLEAKFSAERKAAVEQKLSNSALALADLLAKRAESALAAGSIREALRTYREARWQLPYLPPDLPKHVSHVFGNIRMRHADSVMAVAFNPDGTRLASAGKDGSVKIWDLGNGREIRSYRASKESVRGLAWSHDGKWIASSAGNEIHLWDPETGILGKTLKGHKGAVNSLSFRPDDRMLVSGSDDRTIRIWNVEKAVEEQIVNKDLLEAVIYSVVYSPNGQLVASVNGDGRLHVWNPDAEGTHPKMPLGAGVHSGAAYQVAFSPKMDSLYTCGADKAARQYGGTSPDGGNLPNTGSRLKNFDATGGGHNDRVTALALTPDGNTLVTGSRDKSIRVWDLQSQKVVRTFQGHSDEITFLAFSRDGKQLASASQDQGIRIWNLSSTDEHRNFADHDDKVWSVAYSADGKFFASAGADSKIVVRKVGEEGMMLIRGHTGPVTAIALSHDGSKLVSCGGDSLVKLWEVASGKCLQTFKGHKSAVMAVAFSGDGKLILSGGADKAVKLWDAEKGALLYDFPENRSYVTSVVLRKDGKQALVGSADGMLRIFDLSGEKPKETAAVAAHISGVGGIALNPEENRLATCGGDKLVKVWTISESGSPEIQMEFKGHGNPVSSVAFSADGRLLASGGGDLVVKVWDLQNRNELRSLRGHSDWVSSVAFGSDSRFILSGSVDKTVKLWELSNEESAPPIGHNRQINALAVSADGKRLASGSNDRTIKIWDMQSGQELFTLSEHTGDVTAVAFSPDGKKLVSGGEDRKMRIWDLESKKVISTFDCEKVPVIVFSQKGDKSFAWFLKLGIADQNATTAQVFDANGKELHKLTRQDKVKCLNFTPDGELVAMGTADGNVSIWNIEKESRIAELPAHQKDLSDLAFTPDKTRLITGDVDSEIKIWDIKKREAVKTFTAHKGGLLTIAMSPNGKTFVTVSLAGQVRLWKTEDGTELRAWDLATPVQNIIFTPDSKQLVTANADTTLYVLDLPE